MISRSPRFLALTGALAATSGLLALEKPATTYQVFQFPADKIPRMDGAAADWAMVPESYVIGSDQLRDDSSRKAGRQCAARESMGCPIAIVPLH